MVVILGGSACFSRSAERYCVMDRGWVFSMLFLGLADTGILKVDGGLFELMQIEVVTCF
jgi:hypothetical protein